ncbi:hypothetical protein [Marilutibacter chinensis]|uniref:Nif11 domain-containing protein n=1 Tax=Marilutibacter chinensis TaxID=2912247 RepID=A0ABS9HUF8_9GAMM|nr:hypothetical protein [Lysobacter chinensis]MCF7221792.1 hypothetical protein [Lysobacter chinensis]MCF7223728.1 hypothetical protein [Lysobacter chinensis]
MSNVVKFLETLGQNLEIVSDADFMDAVAAAPVDGDVRQALATRDPARLNMAVGHTCTVLSLLVPAEEEPQQEEETERDAPDEGETEARAA